MALYTLQTVQQIPAALPAVWDFFSNPANLNRITPASMKFTTLTRLTGEKIYKGQLIEYRLRPLLGIPVYWMTEISDVIDQQYFVDEQRKGPYSYWKHRHYFEAVPGGVKMTDVVQYRNPLGPLGDLANTLFVRKKLQQVFDYRRQQVEEIFGKWTRD